MRKKISRETIDELLFKTNHTCCICHDRGKHIQIHHIDENNSNNSIENLVTLCLDCHSKVTSNAGLGHRFTCGEVKRYKIFWEKLVSKQRAVDKPVVKYQKELISQIDIIVCEILATKNNERIEELLNVLYELHLYRGNKELDLKIAEGLSHLALMAGLNSAHLSVLVAEKLKQMCWHFIDPVRISLDNKKFILECEKALGTIGDFSSGYVRKKEATEAFCSNIWQFAEIAVWYNWKELGIAVTNSVSDAIGSCWHCGKIEYKIGDSIIKSFASKLLEYFEKEKPNWEKPNSELKKIIKYNG